MRGLGRRWAVRILAWALRRGVTIPQIEGSLARSFPHRDEEWRQDLVIDAISRNRARVMRSLGA